MVLISGALTFSFLKFAENTFFFDRLLFQKNKGLGYLKTSDWSKSPRTKMVFSLADSSENDERVLGTTDTKDEFVIAIFGDSWSFGLGVSEDETYAIQLEKELAQKYPLTSVKVLNFSISGDNLYDHYRKIKWAKEKHIPIDLYIVQILDNDFVFNKYSVYTKPFDEDIEANEILNKYCVGKEQFFSIQASTIEAAKLENENQKKSFSEDSANYCFFNTLIPKFDQSTVFFYPQANIWHENSQVMRDMISQQNFRLFDIRPLTDQFQNDWKDALTQYAHPKKDPHTVSEKESHPNASYHRFLAKYLMGYILLTPEWQAFAKEQSLDR